MTTERTPYRRVRDPEDALRRLNEFLTKVYALLEDVDDTHLLAAARAFDALTDSRQRAIIHELSGHRTAALDRLDELNNRQADAAMLSELDLPPEDAAMAREALRELPGIRARLTTIHRNVGLTLSNMRGRRPDMDDTDRVRMFRVQAGQPPRLTAADVRRIGARAREAAAKIQTWADDWARFVEEENRQRQ